MSNHKGGALVDQMLNDFQHQVIPRSRFFPTLWRPTYSEGKNPRSRANSTWCGVSTWSCSSAWRTCRRCQKMGKDKNHKSGVSLKVKGFEVFFDPQKKKFKEPLKVCFWDSLWGLISLQFQRVFNNSEKWRWVDTNSFYVGVDGVELHLFSEKWQLPNWRRQREPAKMVTMCPGLFFIFNINPKRSSKRCDLWGLSEVETPFTFCLYWEDFHFLHDLFACLSVCLSVCLNSQYKHRICSPTFSNITVVPCSPGLCSQCSPSPPSPHVWCLQRRGRETCHEREMNTKFTLNESEHLLK